MTEDYNQKSDMTIIMFGKDEFISAHSKRGAGNRAPWGIMLVSVQICELGPCKPETMWLLWFVLWF